VVCCTFGVHRNLRRQKNNVQVYFSISPAGCRSILTLSAIQPATSRSSMYHPSTSRYPIQSFNQRSSQAVLSTLRFLVFGTMPPKTRSERVKKATDGSLDLRSHENNLSEETQLAECHTVSRMVDSPPWELVTTKLPPLTFVNVSRLRRLVRPLHCFCPELPLRF
jgi:hypothetical protein